MKLKIFKIICFIYLFITLFCSITGAAVLIQHFTQAPLWFGGMIWIMLQILFIPMFICLDSQYYDDKGEK